MQTVELKDAQFRLVELVNALAPGDEVIIETDQRPVARLLPASAPLPTRDPKPLHEFAGKFRPLPRHEQDDLKPHDRDWCEPDA
jgi:antitoxin (DNA-binding transcriptional repressor) of toxin-antitoxin stability system